MARGHDRGRELVRLGPDGRVGPLHTAVLLIGRMRVMSLIAERSQIRDATLSDEQTHV